MSRDRRKLRSGFTTGACAAAAAKAAALLLFTGKEPHTVEIPFPDGRRFRFTPHRFCLEKGRAVASVIKDAGDDPDVTNGAEIATAISMLGPEDKNHDLVLSAGEGVGTVTKPGLPVAVGEAAINPVPRRMIREAVTEAMDIAGCRTGLRITVSVIGGEELAAKTLNRRLGIVGGLSILGTTGIVRPVSAKAWTATITASMRVARAAGLDEVVLSTGRTSERAVQELLSLPEEAYAMMGDYLEFSLREAASQGFAKIHLAAMWGKICKAALRIPQTHVRHGVLTPEELVDFLLENGVDTATVQKLRGANTAREIHERLTALARQDIIELVCGHAHAYAEEVSGLPVSLYLVNSQKEVVVRV